MAIGSARRPARLEVLLVANYPLDRMYSMDKFAALLGEQLSARGIEVRTTRPPVVFGKLGSAESTLGKWLGYIDKFVVYPAKLRWEARRVAVIHVCDHSNAMYVTMLPRSRPVVVTCHDLLAVRGATGEVPDCPASMTGRLLQRWILAGLRRAAAVPCVSSFTREDARKLAVRPETDEDGLPLILNGFNYAYARLEPAEAVRRLGPWAQVIGEGPFVLHVGSNQARKNREGVLEAFARLSGNAQAKLVCAGRSLTDDLRTLGNALGIGERIVEISGPGDALLEALYNRAFALLFPSRYEGFGWPVIEAQACGCPVVCSDIAPFREIARDAALMAPPDDHAALAEHLDSLMDQRARAALVDAGTANAGRFATAGMIDGYCRVYERVLRLERGALVAVPA